MLPVKKRSLTLNFGDKINKKQIQKIVCDLVLDALECRTVGEFAVHVELQGGEAAKISVINESHILHRKARLEINK